MISWKLANNNGRRLRINGEARLTEREAPSPPSRSEIGRELAK